MILDSLEPEPAFFTFTCRPEDGGAGIQAALDSCPEGGSILLLEGTYRIPEALAFRRGGVALFGRGAAQLTGGPSQGPGSSGLVHVCCPPPSSGSPAAATGPVMLDGVRILNESEASSEALLLTRGHLRLKRCRLAKRGGLSCVLRADGCPEGANGTRLEAFGCRFTGGGVGIWLGEGIGRDSRVEGCAIVGAAYAGVEVGEPALAGCLSGNAVEGCRWGVRVCVRREGEPFEVGPGNSFAGCAEGDVLERLVYSPPPPWLQQL